MKKFDIKKLVLATNNKGKVREIAELLKPYEIDVVPAGDFPYPEPVETGTSFIENAEIKSRYYAERTGLHSLSDDSGLEVDSLNGEPGVYSADWAGEPRDFYKAIDKVEAALNTKGIKTREPLTDSERKLLKCNFTCLLSFCFPDGKTQNFEGKVYGTLTFPPRGENGFGYDAAFTALGFDKTFGEIGADAKYKISHRSEAFKKFKEYFE